MSIWHNVASKEEVRDWMWLLKVRPRIKYFTPRSFQDEA